MTEKTRYAIKGIIGEDMTWEQMEAVGKIGRLARKHRMMCEWLCNGRKYNADHGPEYTQDMFESDISKNVKKIEKIMMIGADGVGLPMLTTAYQSDPRGYTVKLYHVVKGVKRDVSECLYW